MIISDCKASERALNYFLEHNPEINPILLTMRGNNEAFLKSIPDASNKTNYCIKNNTICSSHGINAIKKNILLNCVYKYDPDSWINSTICLYQQNESEIIDACIKTSYEQKMRIMSCYNNSEGLQLQLDDQEMAETYSAYSSPSLLIGNVFVSPYDFNFNNNKIQKNLNFIRWCHGE